MMNNYFLITALVTSCLSTSAFATEYIYRDLMANTLAPAHCEQNEKAQLSAAKPYTIDRFSKKFCQSQGYGWHVEEIKNVGNTVCDSCGGSQQKCHQEDVVVSCKRIKPGSVGMLPGKG